MPRYDMICGKCGHEEELLQSITKDLPSKCPECNSNKYKQNLEKRFGTETVCIDYCCGVPKSLHQQSERNIKKMNSDEKYELEQKREKRRPKKKKKFLWDRMKEWKN